MTQSTQSPALSPRLSAGLSLTLSEAGQGRPVLVLHGGAGPISVASISQHVAERAHAITPTHPGWNATPRPDWFDGVDDLALAYLQHLEERGLRDVLIIGSSLGGWIGAEMALRDRAGIVTGLILINAGGVWVEGEPIRDVFALDPRGMADLAFHDAEKFFFDPAQLPPEQQQRQRANMASLRVYAGEPYMHDPKLLRRLERVQTPTLAIWGASDRIITPNYGRAYAAAFGNARFELVERAGHLPHIEQPSATFALIDAFMAEQATRAA